MNGSLCACSEPRAYFDSLPPELTWGGYRERIMYGRIAFSALAVVTLIAAAMPAAAGQSTAPGSTGTPIWPTLRHPTGSTRITAGIPAGATGTVSTGTTDMLTRTATPTIGVGERATTCPRPAELVGRGT